MDMGLVFTLLAIILYVIFLIVLKVIGAFKEEKVSLWGPFLMWRTQKGKNLIEKLASAKRFWRGYGSVAVGICIFTMVLMMLFLIWAATLVPSVPRERAPSPQLLIGIPGVNPIIPIWYGIFGLAVAVVIHEFAHGILTRVGGLKVKSLGVVACVVPIGAFVEPDEDELKATQKEKRMRIFGAGPATNIIFAIICALLFSWVFVGSLSPVHEGVFIGGALEDSPAYEAGLNKWWMEIVEINATPITSSDDFDNVPAPDPLQNTTVTYFYKGNLRSVDVTSGVVIIHVSEDYPADNAGIKEGMILAEINGTEIRNDQDFTEAMKLTKTGQIVNITLFEYNVTTASYTTFNTTATLEDKYEYYEDNYPSYLNEEEFKGRGFLGVSNSYLGLRTGGNPGGLTDTLSHPVSNADSSDEAMFNLMTYILLPFQRISPFTSPMTDLYEVNGPLSVLPTELFWVITNILYWLFWLNLMLGLTNALPAVPLDGGHIFKDSLDSIVAKIRKQLNEKERERYVKTISYSLAFLVLFLFLWQLIGPRI
ncbi:MAG: site-2 protease family protein [Thermoplasmata archaeon]|nr:MAG: site-2 protease family protein [Thermoplasmata archaeon]